MVTTAQKKVSRYIISIGLKDKNDKKQKISPMKVGRIMRHTLSEYSVGYNAVIHRGGYQHLDEAYVFENSLTVTLIDVPEETVNAIAERLCQTFNQESVLITKDEVIQYSVLND